MKISVVVPAYNEEKFITKTLESIKAQNRKADEIIVIDGSSTDKTAEVSRKLGATVYTIKKDTIGRARNEGLKKSTGDVVAFTDADTVVPKDWLTRIEKKLSAPGVVGVFGASRMPDGQWWYKTYINAVQPTWNTLLYLLTKMPMATGQNMAFDRKKSLETGGFPENFKIAEDIEIARRMMTKGKIIFDMNFIVIASGRRGNEGFGSLIKRTSRAFFYYFLFRKADKIGFPDMR